MSLCCNLISSRIVFRTSFKHSWALERRGVYSEYLSELWVRLMTISKEGVGNDYGRNGEYVSDNYITLT